MDIISYKEDKITRVEELGKENKQPLMEDGTIFEWSQGNIILGNQEDEEYFENLKNDLQRHNNDDNDSNYVPDNYDGDD